MSDRKSFEYFISKINLDGGRKRFAGNKSVEEDLPKKIQIIKFIYDIYWKDRKFISFDEFIEYVISKIEDDLKLYNKKRNNYSENADAAYPAFLDGWIARQYRTWTSILTQIQLAYVAEEVFPDNEVLMSTELDSKGIDIRVVGVNDYGVKKISNRKDIMKIKREESNGIVPITYWVPPYDIIKNPKTKNGNFRKPYLDFVEDKRLDILDNGFIIFNETIFDK